MARLKRLMCCKGGSQCRDHDKVGLKNERTTLEIGSTFQDDDNWLKGFTLNLTNIYHKPIQYVSVSDAYC
jgi:hypothetical protein